MRIGFHTDAFNNSYWNFERCPQWASDNDAHYIERGLIDGLHRPEGITNIQSMEQMKNVCTEIVETAEAYEITVNQEPVAFCERFKDRVRHVHVKDVCELPAAAARGNQTGIAVGHCAIGDGVNADNIRRFLEILRDRGYTGTLSMESEGQGDR